MRTNTSTTISSQASRFYLSFSDQNPFILRIYNIIQCNLENEQLSVDFLAAKVHLSISQLNRKLKEIINQSADKLIRDLRMKYAVILLKEKKYSIGEIAYRIGYSNPAHFCRSFKKHFGYTPSNYDAQKW